MLAKLRVIIMVLLFGVAMFIAGVLAPESVRAPVVDFLETTSGSADADPSQD